MTMMIREVYEARLRHIEERLTRIEERMVLLQWMLGFNLAISMAVLFKLLV